MKMYVVAVSSGLSRVLGTPGFSLADDHGDTTRSVVPPSEFKIAQELGAEGPTETTGIESSIILGTR